MSRWFVYSFVFAAVASCAMVAAPQASARSLGSFSIDTTSPPTKTPPFGVQLCTAHLRKSVSTGWQYHMASGYDYASCVANAQPYLMLGYSPNPNPGFSFCQCFSGFTGMIVAGPAGNGPINMQDLTQEQVQMYDQGMELLREKYRLDQFVEEHELLLQAIESMSPPPGDN